MKSKLPSGTLDRLWSDPKNWRAYAIYYCKEDPRYVVPKRNKWGGWTVNFGHSAAWITLGLFTVYLLVPILYMVWLGLVNSVIWFSTLAVLVLILIVPCWILSSPKRYEEK